MRHHKHFHKRQDGKNGWDEIVEGAKDLNPSSNDDDRTAKVVAKSPEVVFKTVFKTMEPTFTGKVAGWSTVGAEDEPETRIATNATPTADKTTTQKAVQAQTEPTATARPESETKTEKTVDKTTVAMVAPPVSRPADKTSSETSLPESVLPTKSIDLSSESTLAMATNQPSASDDATGTLGLGASNGVSATSATAPTSSTAELNAEGSSSSTGAKAGIAFGVLGGILIVGLLVWFLFNKRRNQMKQQQLEDDEKPNGAFGGRPASVHEKPVREPVEERPVSIQSTRTSATAPRLSLRPVTQFMPTFNDRRSSKGPAMALAVGSANQNNSENEQQGPPTGNSNHQDNPFTDTAERTQSPTSPNSTPGLNQPSNPFDAPENVVGVATTTNSRPQSSQSSAIGTAVASAPAPAPAPTPESANVDAAAGTTTGVTAGAANLTTAAAGVGLARKASIRKESPAPLDLTRPMPMSPILPSPAGTEFSMSELAPGQSPGPSQSAAAIAAAGGPAATVVYRVQLDFNPTLEDEMELKAGQLVRLLHEYDDGWALCIRLDRSQQGAVPRTCLSTRPVKPRSAGPAGSPRTGPPVIPNSPGPRGPPRGPPQGPPRGPPRGPPNGPPGMRPMTPQGGPYSRPESPGMRPTRPMSPAGRPQSPAGMPPGMRPQSPATGRPMGPPSGRPGPPPGGRPGPPPSGRPGPPPGGRPGPPPGGRPMSPGPRSQSPGPRQQRPQSPNGMNRRMTPPGPSPMNPNGGAPPQQQQGPPQGPPQAPIGRKPVPGQAY
ncbi:hypothetical protein DL764_001184 [Monosporascus ibericus]|uniref:SH3 domain-containing protein n=1 Tax=Monosporascus ibericus TaxID=155417 RepID=A0A4Q4TSA0_9PEZI|nr:hypothetical protein DL764_001184 [Monosporascus ibericus]